MGRCGDGRSPQAVLAHSSEFTISMGPPGNWSAPREGAPGTGCGVHMPGTCTHLCFPVTRPEVRPWARLRESQEKKRVFSGFPPADVLNKGKWDPAAPICSNAVLGAGAL